ncbi:MAG TPA: TlpA disulfide reductase family protein [Candidatus Acidoferrum sp.]|jgi:cytochrome c biogenesis protein CcmG/thiol:disulfide interchange protein DsbE|nr:TlpA disulfide reductase family protein [Candidatus Acidoferrum sp.]
MILKPFLLFNLLVAFSLAAAPMKMDTLKVGSETYSNVTFLGANATDIYFTHSLGIANVKLKYLSPDLQAKFNYDPRASAAAEQKQAEADARYHTNLAARIAAQAVAEARAAEPPEPMENMADPISDKSLLGKRGPAVDAEKWLGDKPDLEGKFVLVSFWAPWSAPCRKSIPDLNTLQKKFASKLVVVGLAKSSVAEVSDLEKPKLEFASGVDSKGKLADAAGVTSIPCVLLLDPKGVVLYQGHPAALTETHLRALLAKGE